MWFFLFFFSSRPGVNFLSRPVSDPENSLPHSNPTSSFQAAPPSGPSSGSRPARGRHDRAQMTGSGPGRGKGTHSVNPGPQVCELSGFKPVLCLQL